MGVTGVSTQIRRRPGLIFKLFATFYCALVPASAPGIRKMTSYFDDSAAVLSLEGGFCLSNPAAAAADLRNNYNFLHATRRKSPAATAGREAGGGTNTGVARMGCPNMTFVLNRTSAQHPAGAALSCVGDQRADGGQADPAVVVNLAMPLGQDGAFIMGHILTLRESESEHVRPPPTAASGLTRRERLNRKRESCVRGKRSAHITSKFRWRTVKDR